MVFWGRVYPRSYCNFFHSNVEIGSILYLVMHNSRKIGKFFCFSCIFVVWQHENEVSAKPSLAFIPVRSSGWQIEMHWSPIDRPLVYCVRIGCKILFCGVKWTYLCTIQQHFESSHAMKRPENMDFVTTHTDSVGDGKLSLRPLNMDGHLTRSTIEY